MGAIANLHAGLTWDLGDFDRGTRHIEGTFGRLSSIARDLGEAFNRFGQRMTVGITAPMVALAGYTVNAASDLKELQSAFDYTFGSSAQTMNRWADQTGNAMGRATSEMKAGALAMGQLFKQAAPTEAAAARLSQRFAVLAQDAASFFNESSYEEALGKIRSGLVGESEPLRAYGVFLTEAAVKAKALEMGLVRAGQELSEQNKIMARSVLITEGLADATGDVERTAGSFANRVRALKGNLTELAQELGERFLPYAEMFVSWAQGAADWISRLPKPIKDIAVGFGAFAAALGPVSLALSAIAVTILPLFLARLGPVFFMLSAVINPIGTLIISLGKMGAAWATVGVAVAKFGSVIAAAITPASLLVSAFALGLGYLAVKAIETNNEIDALGVSLDESNASLATAIERARAAGVDIERLGLSGRKAADDFFGLASAFGIASRAAADLAANAKLAQLAVLNQTRAEQSRKVTLLEQKTNEARDAQPLAAVSDFIRSPLAPNTAKARDNARRITEMELSSARLALENLNREIAVTAATPESAFNRSNAGGAPAGDKPAPRASGGGARSRVQEDLEGLREQMRLEQTIAVARERGDTIAERAAMNRRAIIQLTAEYERTGLDHKQAIKAATDDIAEIEKARNQALAEQIETAERQVDMQVAELNNDHAALEVYRAQEYMQDRIAFWRGKNKTAAEAELLASTELAKIDEARANAMARRLADQESAHAMELARLRGDSPEQITALEERRRVAARIEDLRATGKYKPGEAEEIATKEGLERSRAAMIGTFRDTFRAGLQAAMNGDLGGFFKNWIETRAFDALANVLDRLADGLADLVGGRGGEGGLIGVLKGALGIAGAVSGSSMAKGVGSIGKAAAAAGKSSALPRFNNGGWGTIKGFPGLDTNTLSLNGNPIAKVSSGELLNVQRAGSQASGPVEQKLFFDLRGSVMTEDLVRQMNMIGAQSAVQGGQLGSEMAMAKSARSSRRQIRR